jgi:hypothetical protein
VRSRRRTGRRRGSPRGTAASRDRRLERSTPWRPGHFLPPPPDLRTDGTGVHPTVACSPSTREKERQERDGRSGARPSCPPPGCHGGLPLFCCW